MSDRTDRLRALAADWLGEVDWSSGRSSYGDNAAYEKCARELTAILDAEQDETACGLCKEPATGLASIGETRYCHGDDDDASPTCYEVASWRQTGGLPGLLDALAAPSVPPGALSEPRTYEVKEETSCSSATTSVTSARTAATDPKPIPATTSAEDTRLADTPEGQPEGSERDHDFLPVAGHLDDDECTHRSDGTDATYCGRPASAHETPGYEPCVLNSDGRCLRWSHDHGETAATEVLPSEPAAPAPVPDDEAGKLFAALSYWDQDRDAGPLSDYVTIRVREAVQANGERIAEAIETDPGIRLGHNVSVVCSCLRCEVAHAAARIARDLTREAVSE